MNDMNELSLTTWSQERQGGPRPAWAEVGPASLPDCHSSIGSKSSLLRCGGLCEGFRDWWGDTRIDESDRDSRCSSGHRPPANIRRTGPRITNNRPPYPQRAISSRDARGVSGAFLRPSRFHYNRQTRVGSSFRRELSKRAGHQPPCRSRSVTLPTNLRCPVSSTTGCTAEA